MRALVTGGSGFLGRRIAELLRGRGDEVRVLARQPAAAPLPGAELVAADVRDGAAVHAAVRGCEVVFHVAGKTGYWGPPADFWTVNFDGTARVLAAARAWGVRAVVYTSTPSVVGYARDVENGRDDLPYATSHNSAYAASKQAAEKLVLGANGSGVATAVLRPHLIIGPGDVAMLPRVVSRAARGRLVVIGDGRNRVDLTYVDNAAWAHLDAADALCGADAPCAGHAYFISNGEPVPLWPWLNELLAQLGLPRVTRTLEYRTAHAIGAVSEAAWRSLRLPGEPPITRFLASALARSHWYDMGPARGAIRYHVRVPMAEATRRTATWLASGAIGTTPAARLR